MKKLNIRSFIAGIVFSAVFMSLIFTFIVNAESISKSIDITYKNIKILIDGKEITPKDATGKTVEPFVSDGSTYLPVRAIADAVGYDVVWDNKTNTVIMNKKPEKTNEPIPPTTAKPTQPPTTTQPITTQAITTQAVTTTATPTTTQKEVQATTEKYIAPTIGDYIESGEYVICNTGTKYHYPDCRTVKSIKQYVSVAGAKKAGYDSCGVCHPPE